MMYLQFSYYFTDIVKLHLHFIVYIVLIPENIFYIRGKLVNLLFKLRSRGNASIRYHLTHSYKSSNNSYIYLNSCRRL